MNVSSNSKKEKRPLFNGTFMSIVFGAGADNHRSNNGLRLFVIGPTIILWTVISLVAVGFFYFDETITNLWSSLATGLMIASMIGGAVAIVSLMAHNGYNSEYGWGLFRRTLGYNMFVFLSMVIIDSGIANTKYVESVKEFQFYTTDVDDCQYKITMKSENLTYDYCSDYSTEYKELYAAKEIDAILTGTKKYGDNKADYVEFVKRKVVKQGDKI